MFGKGKDAPAVKDGRIKSVDFFKGFAVTLIIFIHLVLLVPPALGADLSGGASGAVRVSSVPLEFLYSGLMLFFIISGYFYRPGRSYVENVKKRAIQLLVGFALCTVVLTLVLFAVLNCMGYGITPKGLGGELLCVFGGSAFAGQFLPTAFTAASVRNGYYFIGVMAMAFIMFYAVAPWAGKSVRNMAVSIAAFVLVGALVTEFCPYAPRSGARGPSLGSRSCSPASSWPRGTSSTSWRTAGGRRSIGSS